MAGESGVEQPSINTAQAKDAIGQIKRIAQKNGQTFGLNEARTMKIDSLFQDAVVDQQDPSKNKPEGILKAAGWKRDPATESFLENTQHYTQEEAKRGLAELKNLGLDEETIIKSTPEELMQEIIQKNNSWQTDTKTVDYIRNTQGLLKEQQEAKNEKPAKKNATEEEVETAQEGIKEPDEANQSLEDLALNPILQELFRAGNLFMDEGKGYVFEINGSSAEFQNKLDELKKSGNLHNKILAYDLDIAIRQQQIRFIPKNKNVNDLQKIQYKQQTESEIRTLRDERTELATEEASPNVLVKIADSLANNKEEQQLAQNSPLELLSRKITKAITGSKEQFNQFYDGIFTLLGCDEEKKHQLISGLQEIKGKADKEKKDEIWMRAFKGGGLIGITLYLIMKMAATEANGRGTPQQ